MVKRTHSKAALSGKSNEELRKDLNETKKELAKLRNDKSSGSAARLGKIKQVRKNIARILTAMHQNVITTHNIKRSHTTRAMRRKLTPKESKFLGSPKSLWKRQVNFKLRKYVVNAWLIISINVKFFKRIIRFH